MTLRFPGCYAAVARIVLAAACRHHGFPNAQRRPIMRFLQLAGGLSALFQAATFVFGFAVFLFVLTPTGYAEPTAEPGRLVTFLAARAPLLYLWHLVIYVLFGLALIVLTVTLDARWRASCPYMTRLSTAFGLIWAGLVIASGMVANVGAATVLAWKEVDPERAASLWLAVRTVVNGLGGGNEIVGGIWTLLVSGTAHHMRDGPNVLHATGAIVGAGGVATAVPAFAALGAVFGLGMILWFIGIGVHLLRRSRVDAAGDRPDARHRPG